MLQFFKKQRLHTKLVSETGYYYISSHQNHIRIICVYIFSELELWNVTFWQLKKTLVKTLLIRLYSVFSNKVIKNIQEKEKRKRNLILKEK